MKSVEDNGDRIAAELKLLISSNKPTVSSKSSIFRIPNILFKHNKKAYLPNAFSFGPWHHDECNLQSTQPLKINYLNSLLNHFPDPSAKLLELVCAVLNMKDQARQCYAGKISFSDDEFVKILVLDGSFIIEFFLKYSNKTRRDPDDRIFSVPCMLQSLYHDLILLENQIPWFVLQGIFDLTDDGTRESNLVLHQLAIHFFSKIFSNDGLPSANEFPPSTSFLHVIDLLRQCLLAKSSQSDWKETSCEEMEEPGAKTQYPTASALRKAGVKFKRRNSRCLLDIKFRNGVVKVPSLSIHHTTETIFRNLIAFEQSCYGLPTVFTSYAKFMNNLICNADDCHVLCDNDIISNTLLSPDQVAQFFNKICNDVRVTSSHYDDIYKGVNSCYKKRLTMLCVRKYCCCILGNLGLCCCRIVARSH